MPNCPNLKKKLFWPGLYEAAFRLPHKIWDDGNRAAYLMVSLLGNLLSMLHCLSWTAGIHTATTQLLKTLYIVFVHSQDPGVSFCTKKSKQMNVDRMGKMLLINKSKLFILLLHDSYHAMVYVHTRTNTILLLIIYS